MTRQVMLMEGPDAKGLIFHVTRVLFDFQCNIIQQDEYVSTSGQFFMRTEFEHDQEIDMAKVIEELQSKVENPDISFKIKSKEKKDVIILCTREYHCLADLLTRTHFGEMNVNIVAVVSNYDILEDYVSKFGIPYHCVPAENLSREEHEEKIKEILSHYHAEYLVLAKYMRVLTPAFVTKYENRIINIHHSFLPAFVGANPYRQAFDRGVKIIGATAHFVNNELDEGPIIAQDVKEVDHSYSARDMSREGREIEKIVLYKALKLVLEDRVFLYKNRTVVL